MNWKEMEIFKGIDLNDSFVLSWKYINDTLTFDIEASIWPESPFYEKPVGDDYTCYKNAFLSLGISDPACILVRVAQQVV